MVTCLPSSSQEVHVTNVDLRLDLLHRVSLDLISNMPCRTVVGKHESSLYYGALECILRNFTLNTELLNAEFQMLIIHFITFTFIN